MTVAYNDEFVWSKHADVDMWIENLEQAKST